MLHILALACLAALFPLMLSAVVVILTRPRPKRLLLSFLIGGWTMSVTTGLLVLHVRARLARGDNPLLVAECERGRVLSRRHRHVRRAGHVAAAAASCEHDELRAGERQTARRRRLRADHAPR